MSIPLLGTERLILRPFIIRDAPRVRELAGTLAVTDTTLNIPYPYGDGIAETWIAAHAEAFRQRRALILAIVPRGERDLIAGAVSLQITTAHDRAELGYWLGETYWGRGYVTEAARELMRYGFEELGLHRVGCHHMVRNPASGRVMQKLGMTFEGRRRGIYKKGDAYEDCDFYGLLHEDFAGTKKAVSDRPVPI